MRRWRTSDPDRVVLKLFDGINEVNICSFVYDLTTEHTLSFVEEDGKWYLSFDNTVYKYNGSNQSLDLTESIGELLDQEVYYTFTSASTTAEIEGIKLTQMLSSLPSEEFVQASGNETDGYTVEVPFSYPTYKISTIPTTANFSEKDLLFKTPMISNSDEASNTEDGNEWIQLSITEKPVSGVSDMIGNSENVGLRVIFRRFRGTDPDRIVVKLVADGRSEQNVCSFTYDRDTEHRLSIVEQEEKSYLCIDGVTYTTNGNGDDLDISKYVTSLKDKSVYYSFTSASATAEIEGVRFADVKLAAPKGWTENLATVSGNATDGYSISGKFNFNPSSPYEWATYKSTQDFAANDISFKMSLEGEGNDWGYISVTDSPINNYKDILGNSDNGIRLILFREYKTRLTVQVWDPENKKGDTVIPITILPTIYNFDFSAVHRMGFVEQDGKWFLRFDNIIYDTDAGGLDLTKYVQKLKGKTNYYQFCGHIAYEFSGVQFLDSSKQPELPPFNYTGFEVGGNDSDGYSLNGIGNAVYKNPIDLKKQAVSLSFTPNKFGNWVCIGFSHSPTFLKRLLTVEEQEKFYAVELIMTRQTNGNLNISLWNPQTKITEAIGLITDYDWSATHTISFYWDEDDFCYLMFDGVIQYGAEMTEFMEPLSGRNVYVKLASGSGEGIEAHIESFKLVNRPTPIFETYGDAEEEKEDDFVENPEWDNVDEWEEFFGDDSFNEEQTSFSDYVFESEEDSFSNDEDETISHDVKKKPKNPKKNSQQNDATLWIIVGVGSAVVLAAGVCTAVLIVKRKKVNSRNNSIM